MADRWATYEEAGEAFGLSADAMRKCARRLGWRVTPGNDGKARVLIPDGADLGPDGRGGRTGGHPPGHPDGRADGLLAEVRRRAEIAESRAERAEDERDRLATEIIQERERRARAEGEAAGLRVGFEQLVGRVDRAEARADQAEVARREAEARGDQIEAFVVEQIGEAATERERATVAVDAAQLAQARALAAEAEATAARGAAARAEARVTEARAAQQAAEREREAARGEAAQAATERAARQTLEASWQAAEAEVDRARRELAEVTAGGPLRRAWRAFAWRRGRP